MYLQALIGAAIGCPLGGIGSDILVKFITKRPNGYFQPEFRLWALVPVIIACPVGLYLWAAGIQNHLPSIVPIVGWAILHVALCAIPAVAFTYVVACYKPEARECSTVLVSFKDAFAFGISFAVVPWLQKDGFAKVRTSFMIIQRCKGADFVLRLWGITSSLEPLPSWQLSLCTSLVNVFATGQHRLIYERGTVILMVDGGRRMG